MKKKKKANRVYTSAELDEHVTQLDGLLHHTLSAIVSDVSKAASSGGMGKGQADRLAALAKTYAANRTKQEKGAIAYGKAKLRESKTFEAGVWEQGIGLLVWSTHKTQEGAVSAALRYAKRLQNNGSRTGGALSWSGGWRKFGEKTHWVSARNA